ncbi:Candidate ABC type nitrate sulfonate bicarbonate transport system, periplasmic component [Seminavis robusta]|uniref:Candidate ABC type nitrate sulfonate bicarbonate transport system, periplasmic component n=1 Tax=Seminavis robusta TaxID=568900 RepID=A0A9N8ESE1_9STRA|nr:Candidate ABC type nitrate sulfonate bicarbonate transport system, periplasmic component [Seminavis robusta]|eukprot:Sro1560_g282540.1 Candidate ABC type nitrate sulfonate bicarbonate transport system, periplasmic component (395) ;mRNA; f:17631-19236
MLHRFTVAMALLAASAAAKDLVRISIQPAYHAIPIWAAKKYGWFEELGIEVELSVWASGAPQVKAAVEEKAWDFGIAGSVPNVIAGQQVIGEPGVEEWPPKTLTPTIFAGTPKSTGELLLRKCLVAANLTFDDEHILFDQQGPIMEKLPQSGDPQYACLWAPNTYTYREAYPKAKVFCSGRNIDFPIYGGLMMRQEWAEGNMDLAKRVLAAYLRGVSFMQNAELIDEVIIVSDEYHKWSGDGISENAIKEDLILRPLFNLDQQLDHLDRNFANEYISDADRHYIELEEFLFKQGVIQKKFEPREYVVREFMELVSKDPALRAFSYFSAGDFENNAPKGSSSSSESNKVDGALIAGIVLCVVGVFFLAFAFVVMKQKQTPIMVDKTDTQGEFNSA